jgi:hypothetical protein
MLIKNNLTESFNPIDDEFVEVRTRLTPMRTNQFWGSLQRRNLMPISGKNIN